MERKGGFATGAAWLLIYGSMPHTIQYTSHRVNNNFVAGVFHCCVTILVYMGTVEIGDVVELVVPAAAFSGMEPEPLPVGSTGVVLALYVAGTYLVLWDNGLRATHDEIELQVYGGVQDD